MFLVFPFDRTRSANGVLDRVRSINSNLQSVSSSSVVGKGSFSSMVPSPMGAGTTLSGPQIPKISDRLDPRLPIVTRLSADALNAVDNLKTLTFFHSIILKILMVTVGCIVRQGGQVLGPRSLGMANWRM